MVKNAASFDTLEATRELEAAGMDRQVAEATAENIRKASTANFEQLATKADLALVKADLALVKTEIEGEIKALEGRLEGKIEAVKSEITSVKWIVGLQFLLLLSVIARVFGFV